MALIHDICYRVYRFVKKIVNSANYLKCLLIEYSPYLLEERVNLYGLHQLTKLYSSGT